VAYNKIFKQQIRSHYIKNPQVETGNCQQPPPLPPLSTECQNHVGRIRIRKEVNRLTDAEKTILNNALKSAINNADPTTGLYFKDIAHYHGSPTTICGGSPCCPHGSKGFLSWHRLFTGTHKEIGHEEPYYSIKISIFSLTWAGLAAFHKVTII
jgi:hypothetical protein